MAIWPILRAFGKFCDHLVYFSQFWYIFPSFGMVYREKSGNPGLAAGAVKGKNTCFFPAQKHVLFPRKNTCFSRETRTE
jgi:hypothetical protein